MNRAEPGSLSELPDRAVEAMVNHALYCFPHEACGLIAGQRVGEQIRFRMLYCLANSEESSVAYTINPIDHFGALSHAEAQGWELVGAFHSHPHGRAYPSETDIDRAAEPDWTWFVVGLGNPGEPEVAGFSIRDGGASQVYPPQR